jgi:hypothetical protein
MAILNRFNGRISSIIYKANKSAVNLLNILMEIFQISKIIPFIRDIK